MTKLMFASMLATVSLLSRAALAQTPTLYGSQVTVTVNFPTLGSPTSYPSTQTVGPGIEFPSGSLLGCCGFGSPLNVNIDVGVASIDFKYTAGANTGVSSFDGYVFNFSTFGPTITGVSLDSASTFNSSQVGLGFGPHQVTVNLTGLSITPSSHVLVDLSLAAQPGTAQILPQLAFGGGWYTALYFTNLNASPASFTVNFIGNDGNPLTVPSVGGSSVSVNLVGRGSSLIEAPNVGSLVQGYVSMTLPAGVTGYGVFRQSVPGVNDQEAVVLLSGATATTSTLLFDDTKYVTGVAVVNLAPLSTTISVAARDNQGNTIGTSVISLAPNAKTAVVLRDLPGLAGVAGALGSVDFITPIGNLAALGLRFNGLAVTSIPTSDR